MTPATLTGYVIVPLLGAMMCAAPAVTRPTLQFGVRVPPARIGVGWTLNLGNPAAWLIIAVIIATVAGLAVIRIAAGM